MNTTPNYLNEISSIYITKVDINSFKKAVIRLYNLSFVNNAESNNEIHSIIRSHKYLMKILQMNTEDLMDTQKMHDRLSTNINKLQDISAHIESLKTVNLTLAIQPSEIVLTSIREKIYEIIRQDFIIELTLDKKIIGGLILNYNGKYIDLSINKILPEFIGKRKNEIISAI